MFFVSQINLTFVLYVSVVLQFEKSAVNPQKNKNVCRFLSEARFNFLIIFIIYSIINSI